MKQTTKTKVNAIDIDENGVRETKKDGSLASYITSENGFNTAVKKATEDKKPLPEMIASGTFAYKFAENVDEAVALSGGSGVGEYENVAVFLDVFNYGASLRQDNEANRLLTSDSYVQSEDAVDVSYAVAEKVERQKMTNEEKASKMLGITPAQLLAALAAIKGQAASA